jgi:periplasmic copper chaperone A
MSINRQKSLPVLLSFFFLAIFTGKTAQAEPALIFENVWIAEAPPVSKVLAGYMNIKNTGDKDQTIISAQSDDFESVEFHRTIEKNGMASMQHQATLLIPAGSHLMFKPGDYHIMLFKPVRKLRAGDKSGFRFQLENGHSINAIAIVKKASVENTHQQHH